MYFRDQACILELKVLTLDIEINRSKLTAYLHDSFDLWLYSKCHVSVTVFSYFAAKKCMTNDSNVGDCAQTPTWIKPMLLFIKMDSCITGIIGLSSYVSKFFSRREVFLSLKLSYLKI